MKFKYKAKHDSSANFENMLNEKFKAKVFLRFGKLKIKTKHPKETFVFDNPNDCDFSVMTEDQQNRVNLVLNAVLKANGRFLNYKRKQQDKILKAMPTGFLRYKDTRELFLKNSSSSTKDIFDNKMKILNTYLKQHETKSSTFLHSKNLLDENNCDIVGVPEDKDTSYMDYSCRVNKNSFILKIKDIVWKTFVFDKKTEHENFNDLSDSEKHLVANWLNAILVSLNDNSPDTLFWGSRKNFFETFPSDFLRYQDVRENFLKFAGEDYRYLADEKLENLNKSLVWEKGEIKLQDFDLQNGFYKK